jgi:SAM-dependent methyltransferase
MADEQRARSFGRIAALYDRLRPGYPSAAIDAILPQGALRVADIGAGTGKLTSQLVARGLDVVAVEPDAAMRDLLASRAPAADVRAGNAEALPLTDGEVDAVLFAQSWHWADATQAAREAARVLTAGGVLGMLWNIHDDRVSWVAELDEVADRRGTVRFTRFADPPALPGFADGRRCDVAWQHRVSPDELVELISTWSAVSTLPDADRDGVLAAVRNLLTIHPQLVGKSELAVPNVCVTWTYRRE